MTDRTPVEDYAEQLDAALSATPFTTAEQAMNESLELRSQAHLRTGPGRTLVLAALGVFVLVIAGGALALRSTEHTGDAPVGTSPSESSPSSATTTTGDLPDAVLSGTTSDGRPFDIKVTSTRPTTICVLVGPQDIGCDSFEEEFTFVDNHGTPLVYGVLPPGVIDVALKRPDGTIITDGRQIDEATRVWAMPIPSPESATELVYVEPLNLTIVFYLQDGTTVERRRDLG